MRKFARDEFDRNRDVTDIGHIRYLISVGVPFQYQSTELTVQTGRTQFDGMKRYIYEQAI